MIPPIELYSLYVTVTRFPRSRIGRNITKEEAFGAIIVCKIVFQMTARCVGHLNSFPLTPLGYINIAANCAIKRVRQQSSNLIYNINNSAVRASIQLNPKVRSIPELSRLQLHNFYITLQYSPPPPLLTNSSCRREESSKWTEILGVRYTFR